MSEDLNHMRVPSGRFKSLALGESAIVDAMVFPVYILDRNGNIIFANQASIKSFGHINIGDSFSLKFRSPRLINMIGEAIQMNERMRMQHHEPVPTERWFKVDFSPINDAEGDLKDLFVLTFRDITETKRLDMMRTDFIANASHELRTPLTSLRGYVETMQTSAKDDASARDMFLPIMQDQAERMSRLINDLLSLSRIEMQAHITPNDPVDMVEVVLHVKDALSQMAEGLDVSIMVDVPKTAFVRGDRDELVQVVENLIENACKYGQDGDRICCGLRSVSGSDGTIELFVQDFGPGIAPEHVHRLTERFYRVDVESSRSKQGTGLGLAIVKHILTRHKSKLRVESNLGQGSTFIARLELASDSN